MRKWWGAELKEQKEGVFVLLNVEIGVKRTKRVGFCAFDLRSYKSSYERDIFEEYCPEGGG